MVQHATTIVISPVAPLPEEKSLVNSDKRFLASFEMTLMQEIANRALSF